LFWALVFLFLDFSKAETKSNNYWYKALIFVHNSSSKPDNAKVGFAGFATSPIRITTIFFGSKVIKKRSPVECQQFRASN